MRETGQAGETVQTGEADEAGGGLRKALTFYTSFDEEVRGDFGGGTLTASTRHDDPQRPGQWIFREGIDGEVFRIAKNSGIRGGALEATGVLPHRGRIFFPPRETSRTGQTAGAAPFRSG